MFRRSCSLLLAVSISSLLASAAPAPVDSAIRNEVAAEIAGINGQDPMKATAYEAEDMMFTECGQFATFGRASYREGLSMTFKREPAWRLTMIDEGVVVAPSGNEAIYHSTNREDSTRSGVPYTHIGNYVAGFRRDQDGVWRIHWSVVCWQSPSHKRDG